MIELPKKPKKATQVNPRSMILYGHPKIGKTTLLAALEGCLLIDMQEGSDFIDSMKVDIIKENRKQNDARAKEKKPPIPPMATLMGLIKQLQDYREKNGKNMYKYIALDTLSDLDTMAIDLANNLYRSTPMGRNWVGTDVTKLPNGAGYLYHREAVKQVVELLKPLCDTLILTAHVRDKLVEVDGEEINERGIKMTGILGTILSSDVDTVGYLFRDENKTKINFKASKSVTSESRAKHLTNKIITVIESDENGENLKVDWSQIFI